LRTNFGLTAGEISPKLLSTNNGFSLPGLCRQYLLQVEETVSIQKHISTSEGLNDTTNVSVNLTKDGKPFAEIYFSVDIPTIQHERVDDILGQRITEILHFLNGQPNRR
jgi:hypothetical protein